MHWFILIYKSLCGKFTFMKKFLLLLLAVPLLSFSMVQQSREEMITALKQGNIEQFVKYFDNTLDVKLPNNGELKGVQRVQASNSIKTFFKNNNITSFEVTSQRELAGTMYITGKLLGDNSYNLTVMIKSTPERLAVITLRINN